MISSRIIRSLNGLVGKHFKRHGIDMLYSVAWTKYINGFHPFVSRSGSQDSMIK